MTIEEKLQKLAEIKDPSLKMHKILSDSQIAKAILELGKLQGVKGEDGYTPVKGKDYFTDDEIYEIISYIQSQIKDGKDGERGPEGKPGRDGETPVRLIDYWTPEDQIKIVNEVLKRVPKPKDGISPDINEVVKRSVDEIKNLNPQQDFVTVKQLTDFLRRGGFRGGGGSGSGSGTPSLPFNSVQYNNAGAFGGDDLFTRDPSTYATLIGMLQNSDVDVAGIAIGNDLLGLPGTNGVLIRRGDDAEAVGSTIMGIIDGTPLGAPSAYVGFFRADDNVTGESFQQFFFAGNGGISAGDGTDSGIFQVGIGGAELGADNNDGGGNDIVAIIADLNGGAGAQQLRGEYQDGTNSYGFQLANDGIIFDFDGFSGTNGTFYRFPTDAGTNGYVLTTNGTDQLSWSAIPPASATLTATQIGFGDGSNLLSGDADFTYGSLYSLVSQVTPDNSDSLTYSAASFTGSGLNDLTLTWNSGIYTSQKYGGNLTITIDTTGTPDTFNWYFTGGYSEVIGSGVGVMMVPGVQVLNDIYGNVIAHVQFAATTGHTVNDHWNASTSLGGNPKGYNMVDTEAHRFFTVNANGGTYLLGDDGAIGGSQWWGNGTKLFIADGGGELALYAPRYLRFEHPTVGTYTAALIDMQNQIWDTYGRFRVKDLADAIWFEVLSASGITNIGDVQNVANGTRVLVDDTAQQVTVSAQSGFLVEGAQGGNQWLNVATAAGIVQMGDLSGTSNGVYEEINDGTYLFNFYNGIIRGDDLHNNSNVAQGDATEQDVRSGTYTPTLTNVTNISSSTAYVFQWMRVGNVVTVSGKVDITNTATGASALGISLPIASNIANEEECVGSAPGATAGIFDDVGWVVGDATNNRAEMRSTALTTSSHSHYVIFTYQVI